MSKLITVDFHDDTLFAVEATGGVFVALKPICTALGLDPKKQRERVQRDPILSEGGAVMALPSAGGLQETLCLRLDLLNGWLLGIDAARVKPKARDRVLAYKRERCAVLFRHFKGSRAAVHPHGSDPSPVREEPVRIRRQLVAEAYRVFGSRAAGRLWFELGLPIVPEMREGPRQTEFSFTYTALPTPPAAPPRA